MKKPRPKKPKNSKSKKPAITERKTDKKSEIVRTVILAGGLLVGAFSLFSSLDSFIEFSNLARHIVANWNRWTFEFWAIFARAAGHEPSHEAAAIMTFTISMLLLCFSAMTMTPRSEAPSNLNRGVWPWQWSEKYWLHWFNAMHSAFFAVAIFYLAIEVIIFNNSAQAAISNLPTTHLIMGAVSLVGLSSSSITQGRRALLEFILLAICIAGFYFFIASGSAKRAAQAGTTEMDFYRQAVLMYSFAFVPLNMASLLSGAAVRYILLRFLLLAILLSAIFLMNLIALTGISMSAPSHQQ